MLLREPEGVEVVGSGEDPGASRRSRRSVLKKVQGAAGGELRNGVGCDDEDILPGEGQSQIGECGFKGFRGKGREADEETAGLRCVGFCGAGDVSVGCRHRAVWAFLGFMGKEGSDVSWLLFC